jgi:hypothetical protein
VDRRAETHQRIIGKRTQLTTVLDHILTGIPQWTTTAVNSDAPVRRER